MPSHIRQHALTAGANPFWLAFQMGHVDAEMVLKSMGSGYQTTLNSVDNFYYIHNIGNL